ncbi:MAG: hypothetical protein LBM93_04500 [Oscillospiraceae bacterium]|jgi:hypothetical protein|nr:hypothetical protein [Oscillospiraceae bacterium]
MKTLFDEDLSAFIPLSKEKFRVFELLINLVDIEFISMSTRFTIRQNLMHIHNFTEVQSVAENAN